MNTTIKRSGVKSWLFVTLLSLLVILSACSSSSDETVAPDDDPGGTPSMPGGLTSSTYSSNVIVLTWEASTDDDGVRGYEISRKDVFLGEFDALSYVDENLTANTDYTYTVTAIDFNGERSLPVSVTFSTEGDSQPAGGAPSQPGEIRFDVYSVTTAEIFWDQSSDDDGYVVGYEATRDGIFIANIDGLSKFETGLDPTVVYKYIVTAIDNDGNRSEPATVTFSTGSGGMDDIPPSAPANARLVFYANTLVGIYWDSAPEAEQVIATEVLREGVLIGVSEGNSFYDDSRQEDLNYRYQLVAVDVNSNRSEMTMIGFTEDQRLVIENDKPALSYRHPIAISGDTAVIGAEQEGLGNDYNGMSSVGAAYVYTRDDSGNWIQTQRLVSDYASPDYQPNEFGLSVAVDEDSMVIGERVGNFGQQGALHIYSRDASGFWAEAQIVGAENDIYARYYRDEFGKSVALQGDTLLVGASYENNGVVLVFVRDSSGHWSKVQTLEPSDADLVIENNYYSGFGVSISLEDNTALIGSSSDEVARSYPAYVFTRDENGYWSQQQKLIPSTVSTQWGYSDEVAIDGDTIAIGSSSGNSAYIFSKEASGQWRESQLIEVAQGPRQLEPDYYYDNSMAVALDNGKMLLGSKNDDGLDARSGSAYLYQQDASGVWREILKLSASDGLPDSYFGRSVALDGNSALVSANLGQGTDYYSEVATGYFFDLADD